MAVVAQLYCNHRGAVRHDVAVDATLRDPDKRPFDVVVEDLSGTGFLVPAVTRLSPGEQVTLGISGVGMCHARVVREDARGFGCEFLLPLGDATLAAALAAIPSDPAPLDRPEFARTPDHPRRVRDGRLSARARLAVLTAGAAGAWAVVLLAWRAIP